MRTARPDDPTGIVHIWLLDVSPATGAYAYSHVRTLSDLFLTKGLR